METVIHRNIWRIQRTDNFYANTISQILTFYKVGLLSGLFDFLSELWILFFFIFLAIVHDQEVLKITEQL